MKNKIPWSEIKQVSDSLRFLSTKPPSCSPCFSCLFHTEDNGKEELLVRDLLTLLQRRQGSAPTQRQTQTGGTGEEGRGGPGAGIPDGDLSDLTKENWERIQNPTDQLQKWVIPFLTSYQCQCFHVFWAFIYIFKNCWSNFKSACYFLI